MGVHYGRTEDFIFRAAAAFLKEKKILPDEAYKLLDERSRSTAFTVSGYTGLVILQEFLDSLEEALEKGETKEQFREKMNRFLEEHGYEGLDPWRSDTIFRTNLQTAFHAGHYRSMTDRTTLKLRPYWRYRTAGDGQVRDSHAAMEGRVYRADDPIWDIWYPPNGFRCRCAVVSLSGRQMEKMGLQVETKPPQEVDYDTGEIRMVTPDAGFSCNPAKTVWKPDMSGISSELKRLYRERTHPDRE